MNGYQILETVAELRAQELRREAELAALVAEARRAPHVGYRTRLALRLRAWAHRLDPAGEPAFAA
jgi:hypothetical protein